MVTTIFDLLNGQKPALVAYLSWPVANFVVASDRGWPACFGWRDIAAKLTAYRIGSAFATNLADPITDGTPFNWFFHVDLQSFVIKAIMTDFFKKGSAQDVSQLFQHPLCGILPSF